MGCISSIDTTSHSNSSGRRPGGVAGTGPSPSLTERFPTAPVAERQDQSRTPSQVERDLTLKRNFDAWPKKSLAKGTAVYHNTDLESARSICHEGIRTDVENAWGGGELGKGFYTCSEREGAELYDKAYTLKFKTKEDLEGRAPGGDLEGREVPEKSSWDKLKPYEKYTEKQPFLCLEGNETQYKFQHGGTHLELVEIFDIGAEVGCTPDEFKRSHPMPAR